MRLAGIDDGSRSATSDEQREPLCGRTQQAVVLHQRLEIEQMPLPEWGCSSVLPPEYPHSVLGWKQNNQKTTQSRLIISRNEKESLNMSEIIDRNDTVTSLVCDCCYGSGRHAHFPARSCGVCSGSGRISSAVAASIMPEARASASAAHNRGAE